MYLSHLLRERARSRTRRVQSGNMATILSEKMAFNTLWLWQLRVRGVPQAYNGQYRRVFGGRYSVLRWFGQGQLHWVDHSSHSRAMTPLFDTGGCRKVRLEFCVWPRLLQNSPVDAGGVRFELCEGSETSLGRAEGSTYMRLIVKTSCWSRANFVLSVQRFMTTISLVN